MTLYNLIQELYVLLDDGDRRTLEAAGLTPTQYNLLSHLSADVESGPTVTELAEKLLCTRGNVTRLVQRLDKQGLVRMGSDANDQRLVRVALTPAGAACYQKAHSLHMESLARRLGAFEDDADREALIRLNQQLVNHLKEDLTHIRS